MTTDAWIRILSLCIVLAGAETLHGIARTLWITPRIGKERALKLSALTGSALAFMICLVLVPPMGLVGTGSHLLLGFTLATFMAAFDLAIGRFVMRKAWRKLWPDFDPRTGNYLLFGLCFLCWVPVLVAWLRPASR